MSQRFYRPQKPIPPAFQEGTSQENSPVIMGETQEISFKEGEKKADITIRLPSAYVPSLEVFNDREQDSYEYAGFLFSQAHLRRQMFRLGGGLSGLLFLLLVGYLLSLWLAQLPATITLVGKKFDQEAVMSFSLVPDLVSPLTSLLVQQTAQVSVQRSGLETHQTMRQTATYAQGMLQFFNANPQSYHIDAGLQMTTTSGLVIQVLDSGDLPAAQTPREGTILLRAQALFPGSGGNIASHAITQLCPCGPLPTGVRVLNPTNFHGGTDPTQIQIVGADDVNSAHDTYLDQMTQQAQKQAETSTGLHLHEHWIGAPTCQQKQIQVLPVLGMPSTSFQLTITFTCLFLRYNDQAITNYALQQFQQQQTHLLQPDATQRKNEQLILVTPPSAKNVFPTVHLEADGSVTFHLALEGHWQMVPLPNRIAALRTQIGGQSPEEAKKLLRNTFDLQSITISHVFADGFFLALPTSSNALLIQTR